MTQHERPTPKPKHLGTEGFLEWFKKWGSPLWGVVHFGLMSVEEYREEFADILQLCRGRIGRLPRSERSSERATQIFYREWVKRQQRNKSSTNSVSKGDPDWESNLLLCGIFNRGWDLETLVHVTGLSAPSLRYRTYQALRTYVGLDDRRLKPISRQCVRHDLFFVDLALGLSWKDPLQVFNGNELLKHRERCERCKASTQNLDEGIAKIRKTRLSVLPSDLVEWVETELATQSRWFSSDWFAAWPWYVKAPLQITIVLLVVMSVMTIPYVGTLLPQKVPSKNSSSAVVKSQPHSADLPVVSTPLAQSRPKETPKLAVVAVVPAAPFSTPELQKWMERAVPEAERTELSRTRFATLARHREVPGLKGSGWTAEPVETPVIEPPKHVEFVKLSPPQEQPKAAPPTTVAVPPKAEAEATASSAPEKVFFRWGAYSKDLDKDAALVNAAISKFSPERSGELALGAEYKGGRYFHFSVDRKDYDKVLEAVKKLGLPSFTSNRATSDRQTPAGKRRVVFLIIPQP